MKKTTTISCFLLFAFSAINAQITITQNNFPFVAAAIYQNADSATVPGLNTTTGSLWDLGSVQKRGNRRTVNYTQISNDPAFPQATERSEAWTLFGPIAIRQQVYLQKSSTGYESLGIGYEKQTMGLGFLSGSNNDSITFLKQTYAFSNPYTELTFPMSLSTTWGASALAHTNFVIDLLLFGFNNTPCYFDNYFTAGHEVISEGTCRVPAKGSPGTTFDALLVKSEILRVDSFYIDGQPANEFLLGALGVNQSDSVHTYQYRIFRENAGMQQLAVIEFEDDSYTTVKKAEYSAEFDAVSVGDITIENGVLVYPNPVNTSTFFVGFNDNENTPVFTVTDNAGKEVQAIATRQGSDGYSVSFLQPAASGIYYLSISSDTKTARIKLVVK